MTVPADDGSALDRWRQQRKTIADRIAQPLDLQIPGFDDPPLWARYRRLEPDELNGILPDRNDKDASVVAMNADALNLACEGLYEGHPSIGVLRAAPTATGRSAFDVLAEQMDLAVETARDAVHAVFVDDYAVTDAGGALAEWSAGGNDKAAEEHRGE